MFENGGGDIEKILVTGGACFIGSHLIDNLMTRETNASVFDNLVAEHWKTLNMA